MDLARGLIIWLSPRSLPTGSPSARGDEDGDDDEVEPTRSVADLVGLVSDIFSWIACTIHEN